MAITDYKVSETYSGRDIASLSDRPNQDGMTATELKARFDQLNKEVIPNYNDLIDLLDAYITNNDSDIVALENAINGLGISLGDLGLSVQEVLDAYNQGVLSGVYTGTVEPSDPRIKVWINPTEDGIVIDEANRVSAELARVENENTRILNENTRITNENERIANEEARMVFEVYNPLTSYVVGNKVSYLGSSYACIVDSTGNLPTNTTYWLLIASKGDTGANTTATNVTNTPSGNISATTVQGAINELDTEKASKTQEAWITPTLLNGATQADATSYPVGYFKDQLGIVHMRGKITCPTGGSVISMTFPVGYRPIKRILLGALNSATITMSAVVIIENGGVYIGKGATSETISLDGLTFKMEA